MNPKYSTKFSYKSEFGPLTIYENKGKIVKISFTEDKSEDDFESKTIKKCYEEINSYLKGTLKDFTVDLEVSGSDFQKKVYRALLEIPYGSTKTYKDIAKAIGNPNSSRAVGNANNKNPLPIIIPCHRVIGSNGNLIGYAGGLDIKKMLLSIEGRN